MFIVIGCFFSSKQQAASGFKIWLSPIFNSRFSYAEFGFKIAFGYQLTAYHLLLVAVYRCLLLTALFFPCLSVISVCSVCRYKKSQPKAVSLQLPIGII